MDALRLTSPVGPGPGGRRERPTIGLLIGNHQRVGEFERDVAVSSFRCRWFGRWTAACLSLVGAACRGGRAGTVRLTTILTQTISSTCDGLSRRSADARSAFGVWLVMLGFRVAYALSGRAPAVEVGVGAGGDRAAGRGLPACRDPRRPRGRPRPAPLALAVVPQSP